MNSTLLLSMIAGNLLLGFFLGWAMGAVTAARVAKERDQWIEAWKDLRNDYLKVCAQLPYIPEDGRVVR